MAENSHISWTDNTFNPWIGCTRISPACDGCYAAHLMGGGRYSRVEWGEPGKGVGTRSRTAPSNWTKVRKWNRQASEAPGKTFVFCASLADVFDNAVDPAWRRDLFDLIRETPNLTYLLLTKRPGNIYKLFGEAMMGKADTYTGLNHLWPKNAAIGTTIEDRLRLLQNAPALAKAAAALRPAFTFWSCEPLLEGLGELPSLPDWVITGGETDQGAHKARPSDPNWYRSLRDQCAAAGVPFHHKQNGEWCEFGELGMMANGNLNFLGKPDNAPHGWARFGEGDDCRIVTRVGKDRAGRFLDGLEHDARPVGYF